MSKTLKKIIIFAVSLIVVLAIIFAVTVLMSSGRKDADDDKTQTEDTAGADDNADNVNTDETDKTSENDAPMEDSNIDDSSFNEQFEPEEKDEPQSFPTGTEVSFSVDAPKAEYLTTQEDGHIRCTRYEDGSFINIELVTGNKAEFIAPSYLDGYIEYTDIEFSGVEKLGDTDYSAETVTATDGKMQCDGYLIDTDGGTVCIIACYPAGDELVHHSIMAVINTLVIGTV